MKHPIFLTATLVWTMGCSTPTSEESAVGTESAQTQGPTKKEVAADSAAIAPGQYVVNGKMLMVYSRCSAANFLGEAAVGVIDVAGVMHAPEGDLCGGYKLTTTEYGEVTVTWNRDPSAHLDATSISGCMSEEGKYLMMEPGSFVEPKPGTYAKPNSRHTIEIPVGCETPASLITGGTPIARGQSDTEHPAGYLATEEGDMCFGYTYTGLADGTLRITWAPPNDASAARDVSVSAGCKSVEGIYKRR